MAKRKKEPLGELEKEKGIRLNKYLSDAGVCSRREGDRYIEAGKVKIDGETVTVGTRVYPGQIVTFDGKEVIREEEFILLAFYKPKGMTSHDAVYYFRRLLKMKKIGHTGTLDPDARGVLPICIGKGTRVSEYLLNADKEYVGELTLGSETDTQDSSGEIINSSTIIVSEKDIINSFNKFKGISLQIPPMYSALKYKGKKLYELAREGKVVERIPREINIYELRIIDIQGMNKIRFYVRCSRGTYIRTLCNDIGRDLGSYGHMSDLERVGVGKFRIEDSLNMDYLDRLDIEDIKKKITYKTKAIVIINPNNPTGALYPRDVLEQIVQVAREHELMIFSDEIYDRLVMDNLEHISIASLAPDLFCTTFSGLSKSHMVAGFRVGWMVLSGDKSKGKDYIEGLNMLSNMRLCSNVPAQRIIQTALGGYQSVEEYIRPGGRIYEQREYIYDAVNNIPGLSAVKPKAAFYIFPKLDVDKFNIKDDEQFAYDLLREKQILIVHGGGFNWEQPDHFRIVYLPNLRTLKTAADHLADFLDVYHQE